MTHAGGDGANSLLRVLEEARRSELQDLRSFLSVWCQWLLRACCCGAVQQGPDLGGCVRVVTCAGHMVLQCCWSRWELALHWCGSTIQMEGRYGTQTCLVLLSPSVQ